MAEAVAVSIASGGSSSSLTGPDSKRYLRRFPLALLILEVIFVILYGTCTTYDQGAYTKEGETLYQRIYPEFQDVHVMILIGFGFLMTFLRKYGFSAVGINFLVSALAAQWYLLVSGFITQAFAMSYDSGAQWHPVRFTIARFIEADFCAAAVLITFGALLGRTTPLQIVVITLVECAFYSVNENVAVRMGIVDVGGSMIIHLFGAYFGLTASRIIAPHKEPPKKTSASSYTSDLFAMIGTLFLWVFWPSFNSVLSPGDTSRERCAINTLFSIGASCISAYCISALAKGGHFSITDVQNATLAGGVAVGSVANMAIQPAGAIAIGMFAGGLSAGGFSYLTPYLEKKITLHDTCGVHNLHGMPAMLSAIASAVAAAVTFKSKSYYDDSAKAIADIFPLYGKRSAVVQGGYQFAFAMCSLALAIGGGTIAAFLAKIVDPTVLKESEMDSDKQYWDANWEAGSFYNGSMYGAAVFKGNSNKNLTAQPSSFGNSGGVISGFGSAAPASAQKGPPETPPPAGATTFDML